MHIAQKTQRTLTDHTAVDWNDYVYAFDAKVYIAPDSVTIQLAGEYPLTTTNSAANEVGTLLVIYQEESGSDMIIVY